LPRGEAWLHHQVALPIPSAGAHRVQQRVTIAQRKSSQRKLFFRPTIFAAHGFILSFSGWVVCLSEIRAFTPLARKTFMWIVAKQLIGQCVAASCLRLNREK